MPTISSIPASLGLQSERALSQDATQVLGQTSQAQTQDAPQRAEALTLRGSALADDADSLEFADAKALLQQLVSDPQALLEAHNAISPASMARLLELEV